MIWLKESIIKKEVVENPVIIYYRSANIEDENIANYIESGKINKIAKDKISEILREEPAENVFNVVVDREVHELYSSVFGAMSVIEITSGYPFSIYTKTKNYSYHFIYGSWVLFSVEEVF